MIENPSTEFEFDENSNISAVILVKNEEYNLIDCVNHIKKYVSEIVVIDSSDNDLTRRIAEELGCRVYELYIGKDGIKGFADLRNFGQEVAVNNWCLHVDVDELFSSSFFNNLNKLSLSNDDRVCYKFPRVNLPFYEKYPDYQTRLVNKKYSVWEGVVHEKVYVDESIKEIILNSYPIVHSDKSDKIDVNKKWSDMSGKNVLIISMFKDCEKLVDEFFVHLNNLIDYSTNYGYNISICFVVSDSFDDTNKKVDKYVNKFRSKDMKCVFESVNINNIFDRFDKLAIMRNMSIKFGLNDEDCVLIIDSDTIFSKDLLVKLVESLYNNKFDALAPLIFIENFRDYGNDYFYDTLAFIKNGEKFNHFYPYTNIDNNDVNNNIIEVDSVGTCYLIKGYVFNINDFNRYNILRCFKEKEKGKFPVIYEGGGISEQVRFFNNFRNADYKVGVDFNIKMFHMNLEQYGMSWH